MKGKIMHRAEQHERVSAKHYPDVKAIVHTVLHEWRVKLKWLLEPSAGDFAFALRSSLAAILALLIAMWMELGSPQWAPLSVWVVAQSSRGESMSKARWRIAGTMVGCCFGVGLIGFFPQETILFFAALAIWIGLCCGFATFFQGYRAYGLVLTGFTSAIVATGAISEPDHAFDVAIARGTYIILGVICEATLALVFMPSLRSNARKNLKEKLDTAMVVTSAQVSDFLSGHTTIKKQAETLTTLVNANARVEFDALEMGPHTRAADHARAALSVMLIMLARARGLFFLAQKDKSFAPGAFSTLFESDRKKAMSQIEASLLSGRKDNFHFRLLTRRHSKEAIENGIRAAAGIIGAWLVWEITAWPAGPAFISFVALCYGLIATRDNPILASAPFFRGAVWCAAVAWLYVFLVIPRITSPELLVFALLLPMTIGGLAARHASTAGYAFSFNMFLVVLMGPSNTERYDEQSFLNGALAFLLAILFVGWTYRTILPFQIDSRMRRISAWRAQCLKNLAQMNNHVNAEDWLSDSAESLVRTLRNAQTVPDALKLVYMQDQLKVMNLGMSIIALRTAQQDEFLPQRIRRGLQLFLRRWEKKGPVVLEYNRLIIASAARQLARTQQPEIRHRLEQVDASFKTMLAEYKSL
ncbi:FUSC family protein [Acetobacter thailandicus]|nr:FUSC family protein [Acetobacter thailandicus]